MSPRLRQAFLPLTVALRVAPAVNFGALDALIFSEAPVAGLRPSRARGARPRTCQSRGS